MILALSDGRSKHGIVKTGAKGGLVYVACYPTQADLHMTGDGGMQVQRGCFGYNVDGCATKDKE